MVDRKKTWNIFSFGERGTLLRSTIVTLTVYNIMHPPAFSPAHRADGEGKRGVGIWRKVSLSSVFIKKGTKWIRTGQIPLRTPKMKKGRKGDLKDENMLSQRVSHLFLKTLRISQNRRKQNLLNKKKTPHNTVYTVPTKKNDEYTFRTYAIKV